jgi:hypothetical protein
VLLAGGVFRDLNLSANVSSSSSLGHACGATTTPVPGVWTLVEVPIAKSRGAVVHSADHQQLAATKIHADRDIFLNRHG